MTYRVVQWATGAMGRACLRGVIDHPGTELVGLYAYGADKVGKDAGDIARRDPTGVIATNSVEEILALDADVVIHAARLGPYGSHDADFIPLLESGKNVISINGYSWPNYWADERIEALEAACQKGGSSLMAAGLNPGFVGEQLAVVVSGLTTALEHVQITENADGRDIKDPDYLFGALGFGADPTSIDPDDPTWRPVAGLNGMYEESVASVARELGMTLDRIEADHRLHLALRDLDTAAGVVRKGTVSHTNWRWNGIVDGKPKITLSIHWYIDTTHLEQPDPPLWKVDVNGHPGVAVSLTMDKHRLDTSRASAEEYALAATVLNAIPHVVAAAPGIVSRPAVTPYRYDYSSPHPLLTSG
jgi:2,4-diaminopentanoate dehydrogenase